MSSVDSGFSLLEPSQRPALPQTRGKAAGRRNSSYSRWHLESSVTNEEDGWLLTYLDVITLMLVMMVVMLSVAGPQGEAHESGTPASLTPPPDPLATAAAATVQPPLVVPPVALPVTQPAAPTTPIDAKGTPPQAAPAPPADTWANLKLEQVGQDIAVTPGKDSVRFRISNELLFPSGDARLVRGGDAVLDKLLPTLLADPELRLVVEGHTDNIPIQTERYPSNWELSTGRAASVARYLIEHGVAPQRVQASGYADTRPIGGKDNPVDRNVNRRVELILEKVKPPG
ncbi:OmpA family protein [Hydrogenophaga sp. PAMC20947]|uniref:OmpA/MotB family protein n=1 Tax=Hydrogenophaga sp. PAMC20947 TaxID=2565558 RepID=UPI00109DF1F6|nr:OmpA family protein [Hydrogenophaga sp. PAMC20947]QCB45937.1 flagellar motor protein MotB [Hydrogenophaga sp. PAMC20947]